MAEIPTVEADVTFLTSDEGGRKSQLSFGSGASSYYCPYCPHLVMGDPAQRHAIVRDGNVLVEEYLGVKFVDGPDVVPFGKPFVARMSLMYYPDVDYSAVVPGATFTIREGGKVVGFGRITVRTAEE